MMRPHRPQSESAKRRLNKRPVLTKPEQAQTLEDINRLEILDARPALLDQFAAQFPDLWYLQTKYPHVFENSWSTANKACDEGRWTEVPQLLRQAAVYEAARGDLAVAIELCVWTFIFGLCAFNQIHQRQSKAA